MNEPAPAQPATDETRTPPFLTAAGYVLAGVVLLGLGAAMFVSGPASEAQLALAMVLGSLGFFALLTASIAAGIRLGRADLP